MTQKLLSWKIKFIPMKRKFFKKYSSLSAEEEKENLLRFHTVNNNVTNTTLQRNPEQKTTNGHGAQKRIVPGIYDRYVFNFQKGISNVMH